MYRRSHEIKPTGGRISATGSIIHMAEIAELSCQVPGSPLFKKNSMCESPQNGKDLSQPPTLSFSARAVSKRKLSCYGDFTDFSNKAKLSRYVNNPHLESNQTEQLKEAKEEIQKLRKDYQDLKNQNEIILGHLAQSKRAFQNLNSAYESKCQQTETLKSIVNSIKDYVFKEQKPPMPLSPKGQITNQFTAKGHNVTYTKSIIQNKPKQNHVACRRRVSIKQTPIIMNASELDDDDMEQNVRAKIEHYTKMKIVQSIKGSTYDIYSEQMI